MQPASRRVTLREIASRAGVHFTTVSLALRHHPRIPEPTRARIQSIARSLGYVPDPMLASLSSYRTGLRPAAFHATLGWLTSFPTRNGWSGVGTFVDFHRGAAARAAELGYRLEDFWLREPGVTPARMNQILRTRNVSGVVIAPLPESRGRVDLDWSQVCAVTLGYSLADPALHTISSNQYRCLRLAMAELDARGYARPGLVMLRSSDDRVDHKWLAGYLVVENDMKKAQQIPPLLISRWDPEVFLKWHRTHRPDAVLTKCPEVALLTQGNRPRLPRDTAIAHLASVPEGQSGVDENPTLVGAAAIDYLVGMLHRNERGLPKLPHRLLIDGTWVDGGTLRPRSRHPALT